MRKLSTQIGVYAILLIAALYGSTSLPCLHKTPASGTAVTLQKAASSSAEEKAQTTTQNFHLPEDNNGKVYSVTLQPTKPIFSPAGAELNFFTHSAITPYYINTL